MESGSRQGPVTVSSRPGEGDDEGGRLGGIQCTICLDDEGDVAQRGCCCRGDAGAVHLQCLIDLATHTTDNDLGSGWTAWWQCGTCKQALTGTVQLELAEAWFARVETRERTTVVNASLLPPNSQTHYGTSVGMQRPRRFSSTS